MRICYGVQRGKSINKSEVILSTIPNRGHRTSYPPVLTNKYTLCLLGSPHSGGMRSPLKRAPDSYCLRIELRVLEHHGTRDRLMKTLGFSATECGPLAGDTTRFSETSKGASRLMHGGTRYTHLIFSSFPPPPSVGGGAIAGIVGCPDYRMDISITPVRGAFIGVIDLISNRNLRKPY